MTWWLGIIVSLLSALCTGFTIAWRMGARLQRIEDRLDQHEKLLNNSEPHIDTVPVLAVKLEMVLTAIRDLSDEVKAMQEKFVTRRECEQKHAI